MRDNRGFTLIELIMVISILSIVLLIPVFKGNIICDYKEKKELKEFKNDISYARNKAIIESIEYCVDMRPDDNSYIIFKHGFPKTVVKKKEFTNGIRIKYTNIVDDEIIFGHSGAPDKSGTISLINRKGELIRITVTPATGKVNIYFD